MPLSSDLDGLLSEFRGMPYFGSKAKAHFTKGQAEPLSDIVASVFETLKIGQKTPQQVILENWKNIVYGNLATLSSPALIRGNALYIRTENPIVRQNLSFDRREILKNINSLDCCENIKEIRFM